MWLLNQEGSTAADRNAWWSFGKATPARRNVVNIPGGASFLWLDPSLTGPNVVMGVVIGSALHFMKPGDVLPLPAKSQTVHLFNPYRTQFGIQPLGHTGFVCLRAGAPHELAGIMARAGRSSPLPQAAVLYAASVATDVFGVATVVIPTGALRGVRVTLHPLGAGVASPMTALPADFACSIDVGAVLPAPDAAASAQVFAVQGLPMNLPGASEPIEAGLVSWSADNTLAGAPGTNTWDRPVAAGAYGMALNLRSVSGAGARATHALLVVEGY